MITVTAGKVIIYSPVTTDIDLKFIAKRVNRATYFLLLCSEFHCHRLFVHLAEAGNFAKWGLNPSISGSFTEEVVFINTDVVKREKDIIKIILHEFFHHLMKKSGTKLPIWIDEGLAEYFSGRSLSYL